MIIISSDLVPIFGAHALSKKDATICLLVSVFAVKHLKFKDIDFIYFLNSFSLIVPTFITKDIRCCCLPITNFEFLKSRFWWILCTENN